MILQKNDVILQEILALLKSGLSRTVGWAFSWTRSTEALIQCNECMLASSQRCWLLFVVIPAVIVGLSLGITRSQRCWLLFVVIPAVIVGLSLGITRMDGYGGSTS